MQTSWWVGDDDQLVALDYCKTGSPEPTYQEIRAARVSSTMEPATYTLHPVTCPAPRNMSLLRDHPNYSLLIIKTRPRPHQHHPFDAINTVSPTAKTLIPSNGQLV